MTDRAELWKKGVAEYIDQLTAERDAALAALELSDAIIVADTALINEFKSDVEQLESKLKQSVLALREAKAALLLTQEGSEFAACLPDEWSFAADKDNAQMKQAITTINKVLGDE